MHSLPALYPSCLHTTLASVTFQVLLHTVPHSLLLQISTRPSKLLSEPASRTSPSLQPMQKKSNWHWGKQSSKEGWGANKGGSFCKIMAYWCNLPAMHTTPASWLCEQLWARLSPLFRQSKSLLSCPPHLTSSSRIGVPLVPSPNAALILAKAPIMLQVNKIFIKELWPLRRE